MRAWGPTLTFVVAIAFAAPAWADDSLRTARQQIQAGEFLLALESAEAASRVAPEDADVLLVKALAYEGLGQVRVADALLRAHGQQSAGSARSVEADRAAARVAAQLELAPPGIPAASGDLRDFRPADVLARAQAGVAAGRCWTGRAAAYELLHWRPGLADSWRAAGDASRCLAEQRNAVRAYRAYQERGGADPGVLQVLETLARSLASVTVTVQIDDPTIQPRVFVQLPDERLEGLWTESGLRFSDLPVGTPSTVTVAGKGLQPTTVQVPALGPGQDYPAPVAPLTVGLGTVRVAGVVPDGLSVRLETLDEVVAAEAGSAHVVTAGDVLAVVSSEHGVVQTRLDVPAGSDVGFDPAPYAPTLLTVLGVPAGAELRVFVEGAGDPIEQILRLSPSVGAVDAPTGLRIAPPSRLDSLVGGGATLFVEHPVLGGGNASLALLGGAPNATTFDWASLPGVGAVAGARASWIERDLDLTRRWDAAAVGSGVGAGLLGGGVGLGVAAVATDVERDRVVCWARAPALGDCEGVDPGTAYVATADELARSRTALTVAAAVAGGAGLVATVVSALLRRRAATERAALGEWDPDAVAP